MNHHNLVIDGMIDFLNRIFDNSNRRYINDRSCRFFSDALGIHISQESDKNNSKKNSWIAILPTLLVKLGFTLTFLIPIFLFSLQTGIIINILRGLSILMFLNYRTAKNNKKNIWHTIIEHISIAIVVIITYYIGVGIAHIFST